MNGPSYPASRAVAPNVASHFARRHAELMRQKAPHIAAPPSAESVEALIAEAFWASLQRQEGYQPTISLAYLTPAEAFNPLLLETPLPLEADSLARLAPAVERPGVHLGVCLRDNQLEVWGATHTLPPMCCVIEVVTAGLLVIKRSSTRESGKFVNVAVLEGDRIKELIGESPVWPESPPIVRHLLGLSTPETIDNSRVMVQLAGSMRKHGRGGLLLIVPRGTDAWRQSIVVPMAYAVSPLYRELRDLMNCMDGSGAHLSPETTRVVDMVAGLTAVDGASVMTEDCELLAFGVKITRRDPQPSVERVIESEPIGTGVHRVVHPTALGGTRHLSAAQFAHDQRESIALVASQDGRFTVFAWAPSHEMVQAYRIETLLL